MKIRHSDGVIPDLRQKSSWFGSLLLAFQRVKLELTVKEASA